jgi:hypothetical protein
VIEGLEDHKENKAPEKISYIWKNCMNNNPAEDNNDKKSKCLSDLPLHNIYLAFYYKNYK